MVVERSGVVVMRHGEEIGRPLIRANGTGLLVPSYNRNITVIEPTSNHIDVTSPSITDTATRVACDTHRGSTPDARETTATRGCRGRSWRRRRDVNPRTE